MTDMSSPNVGSCLFPSITRFPVTLLVISRPTCSSQKLWFTFPFNITNSFFRLISSQHKNRTMSGWTITLTDSVQLSKFSFNTSILSDMGEREVSRLEEGEDAFCLPQEEPGVLVLFFFLFFFEEDWEGELPSLVEFFLVTSALSMVLFASLS